MVKCNRCNSDKIVKNGKVRDGIPRYKCKDLRLQFCRR